MENNEEQKVSKYNQALASLMRIDNLWTKLNMDMLRGKYGKAKFTLDRIWGELSADSSKEDEQERLRLRMRLETIKLEEEYRAKHSKGYGNEVNEDELKREIMRYLYPILMHYETFLRKLQNKQGKGSSYISSDEEDLD